MNKKTYTLEDFFQAVANIQGEQPDGIWCDKIEKAITKPRIEFKAGEVYARTDVTGTHYYCNGLAHKETREVRKLTTTEAGAQELIDAMMSAERNITRGQYNIAGQELAKARQKWREDRNE